MTDRFIAMIFFSAVCALPAAPLALGEGETAAAPSFDEYKIITERNIFLRERPRPAPSGAERRPPPPPAESLFTLTGIIRQGEEYIAFIEETRKNVTTRVRVGGTFADGRVVGITLDGIVYEKDGKTAELGLGQRLSGSGANIAGADSGNAPEVTTPNQGGSATPLAPAPSTGAGLSDVLQRLREKRQMEMNKR